jgi:hypothetical protein
MRLCMRRCGRAARSESTPYLPKKILSLAGIFHGG